MLAMDMKMYMKMEHGKWKWMSTSWTPSQISLKGNATRNIYRKRSWQINFNVGVFFFFLLSYSFFSASSVLLLGQSWKANLVWQWIKLCALRLWNEIHLAPHNVRHFGAQLPAKKKAGVSSRRSRGRRSHASGDKAMKKFLTRFWALSKVSSLLARHSVVQCRLPVLAKCMHTKNEN